jgi:hypothetical protein
MFSVSRCDRDCNQSDTGHCDYLIREGGITKGKTILLALQPGMKVISIISSNLRTRLSIAEDIEGVIWVARPDYITFPPRRHGLESPGKEVFPILKLVLRDKGDMTMLVGVASKSKWLALPFCHRVHRLANQITELLRLDLLSRRLSPMTPLTLPTPLAACFCRLLAVLMSEVSDEHVRLAIAVTPKPHRPFLVAFSVGIRLSYHAR